MLPRKTFIYFLLDTPSGKAYYRDKGGTVLSSVIAASKDVTLQSPANWLDTTLSYERNHTYQGIARSYSTPQEFVKDAQAMIKELFLLGVGTEVPLTLAVFKYNSQPKTGEPEYKLYFKANLDLTEINETVLESLTAPLMEGGVTQLLKSYENTTVTIPCDGSIVENQKVNLDGLLVPDVFYYNYIPFRIPASDQCILPLTFVNNEGDNYGIIHADPFYENILNAPNIDRWLQDSSDFIFYSNSPITVNVKGYIILKSTDSHSGLFTLMAKTNIKTLNSEAIYLIPDAEVIASQRFDFSATINLTAFEKLFFTSFSITTKSDGNFLEVIDGNISLSFESMAKPTRAWAVQSLDLFKLIIGQIDLLSSTQFQTFNYQAVSELLSKNSFFYLSGDSLRASGDATYQRFYSISETNQIVQSQYGPVIKITLKDFFQSIEAQLCAELQSQDDSISIEQLESIYNAEKVDFSIGEVASLKWGFAKDLGFSDFEIGYPSQSYDQKAGKYEYNTTLEMKAPINSFQKKFSKISKIRWDSYGIERLRSNIGGTSTTRNDSDNSVFGLNVNKDNFIYDYFNANFTSSITNPDDSNNTNINLDKNVSCQPIQMPIMDGEYFQSNLDQSIIVISDRGQSATEACSLIINGIVNSNNNVPDAGPATITIKIWHNGQVLFTSITEVTSINTPIAINHSFSLNVLYKDCFYITMETTANASATINNAAFVIGDIITNASASNVPVGSGIFKLLSFSSFTPSSKPYVVGTSRAQYGYQYFSFNSMAINTDFLIQAGFDGYISNENADFVIEIYINGILQSQKITVNGTVSRFQFLRTLTNFIHTFKLNDIVFFTASVLGSLGDLTVSLTSANLLLTSTQIKAYSLKRVQYDSLTGIPNLAKNQAGEIRTDIAGAPYNIEDVTPKTIYRNWRNYIMSCFMKVTGDMKFQTLSKNPFLSRTFNGVTITENLDEAIMGFKRLFYPINLEMKVNVPQGFAELMSVSKNAHIHCTFMGTDIYFFSDSLSQKPALNESQVWKGKLSPKTDLAAFSKINSFKIPDMQNNSLSCAFSSPVQFIPYAATQGTKYHTLNRNTFLFKDQLENWLNKDDYGQPVQIGDQIPLQFIARGLSGITYSVYRKLDDSLYLGPISLDVMISPAIVDPYTLWQKSIDTTGWDRDNYYLVISASGSNVYRSEPLLVRRPDEMEDTVLIEYSHSSNTQGLVFDAGFKGSMRIRGGFNNKFKQRYLGKFYTDQPQDITVLNAIPYEITTLLVGRGGGVPDYVAKKVLRALLMDGCTLDGEGFSLNDGAQFEEVFTKGAPMKFHSIEIRPAKNLQANAALPSGMVDNDSSLIVSVNPQAFGPNVSNSSGTTDTDLIQITVN